MEPLYATTPGATCDSATRLLAAEAMLKRLAALSREIEGVRLNQDVECVHRMRVASRRLRTALKLFGDCFPQRQTRTWAKGVRRITRRLGQARDADVQIQFVDDVLHRLDEPKARPGISRLALRLRQQRQSLQADVCAALDRLEQSGLIEEMTESLLQVRVQSRLGIRGQKTPTAPLLRRAYMVISYRLEELLTYEPLVEQEQAHDEHHAMRIAAKHLRYAMEVFSGVHEDVLAEPIKLVREFQSLLGDVHDCDVWVEQLPLFLEQERRRTQEFFGHARGGRKLEAGILHLQADRRRQREKLFGKFQALWRQARSQDVWRRLVEALAHPLEQASSAVAAGASRSEAIE